MTSSGVTAGDLHPEPALRPVRDIRHGHLVGVEALAGAPFPSALAVLPMVRSDVWLAAAVTPDLLMPLESSPLYGVPGEERRRVVLTISALAPVADHSLLGAAVDVLRDQGVRLAVGHVEADYASLSRILRLRPDAVTVHPSLVRSVGDDRAKRTLVAAVVAVARNVGAQVAADGVETAEDLEAVAALGVDLVQGGLVGHPSTDPAVWQRWSSGEKGAA